MTRRRRQLLNTAEDLSQSRDLDNVTHFEPRRETVGDLLRRAREGKGKDLDAVATKLRIRPGYLRAIEAGRFQDLPGLTYAVGFVRTYADHLGLDAEDVVRRFRDEVAELKSQTQLIFPVGVAAEGKMPRGAILLLSAVLAAIAYGGWYYLSEREQSTLELIPELPAKLKALVSGEEPAAPETVTDAQPGATMPDASTTAPGAAAPALPGVSDPATVGSEGSPAEPSVPAPVAEAVPEPVPVPVPETPSDPVAESAAAASALPSPAPTAPAPAANAVDDSAASAALMSENSTQAPPAPSVPAPAVTPAPSTSAQIPEAPPLPSPEAPPAPAAPSLDASGLPTVAAPTPAAPATETLTAAAPSGEPAGPPPMTDGQAFGAVDGPSRIVLVARLESWVQVTDPETNALLTRVLRAGDRYYVPDEAGLNLATGNAGGIDIWVDGRKVAPLGPVGVVRRGVVLDPQRLADGTALPE